MISIKNQEIRSAVKEAGIKMWQLADEVGIADTTLCRRLRHELSEAEKAHILEAISRLSVEVG